jgi:hypothetical protein
MTNMGGGGEDTLSFASGSRKLHEKHMKCSKPLSVAMTRGQHRLLSSFSVLTGVEVSVEHCGQSGRRSAGRTEENV